MNTLFVYNPTCDMAIENGTYSYMPPKNLANFENDISPLMGFLGQKDDYILYNNKKPSDFIAFWNRLDVKLPRFVKNDQLKNHSPDRITPWGWSQIIEKQHSILTIDNNRITTKHTHNTAKNLFSRTTSVKLINALSQFQLPSIASLPSLPITISTIEEIFTYLKCKKDGIVIKNLWSSSGRGIVFIRYEGDVTKHSNWIKAQLKKQQKLILEPKYNKIQDASMQFHIDEQMNYTFLGINFFDSDHEGRFEKEYFHIPETVKHVIEHDVSWIKQLADLQIQSMREIKLHDDYQGAIGIDVMFILNEQNQMKLYPLVEANLRCNMGLINLHIKKHLAESAKGHWQISTFESGEAIKFYNKQMELYPIQTRNNKISEGFFPLTPFTNNCRFAAWGLAKNMD